MKTHDASSPPVSSTESRCTSLAETSGSVADRSSNPKAAIVQRHAIEQAKMAPAERQVWEALSAEQVNPALAVPLV